MTDLNRLYYMRDRYYNSEIKRFVNQDVILGSINDGRGLNRYAFVRGNPISSIDPRGLWDERVHRFDTLKWAESVGFSAWEASIVANGNLDVDVASRTEPFFGDQSWHFDRSKYDSSPSNIDTRIVHANRQLAIAVELMKKEETYEKGLFELGLGLHALQDIQAHMDQGYNTKGRITNPHDDGYFNHLFNRNHFDDPLYDYYMGEWKKRPNKEGNYRWALTEALTLEYLESAYKSKSKCRK